MLKRIINALHRLPQMPGFWLALGFASLLLCVRPDGLAREAASAGAQSLSVTASFTEQGALATDDLIELRLSRSLQPPEGRLAVFIGLTDLTGLFTATADGVRYNQALPLPAGETEVNSIW